MFDFEQNSTVTISEKLKARFCKDSNLPIKIYSEPYFENFIRLFDNQYGTIEKYKNFIKTVQDFGSEEAFLGAYNKLKDDVIDYLSNVPMMQYFNKEEDMNKFVIKNIGITEKDIYHKDNDGHFFISIDMVKANFTALCFYSGSTIFAGKETYEDFMRIFTDVQYFIDSKHIRQVIFGKLNNRRQITYEKYLMDLILTRLLKYGVDFNDICSFSHDEIVIKLNISYIDIVEQIMAWAKNNNIPIRCEGFELKSIPGTKGFVRKFLNNKNRIDFKCIDYLSLPFVLRAYNGEKPNELDRVFIHDGKKAQLLEDIKVEAV